ncbi:MAG: bifunctional hydroxymethylpyrimidine kinase/phosphomethylpyrimidine kinase [Deinococcota bacterium]
MSDARADIVEPRLLTIAGSDSGGAAGLQADLKTFTALGVYGMSVTTVLTAQNTLGVQAVERLPAAFVAAQLDAVSSDIGVDGLKTGLLGTLELVDLVASKLAAINCPKVIDPVLVNSSGALIVETEVIDAYKRRLFGQAMLVTPNLREAQILSGTEIRSSGDIPRAAKALLASGPHAVLIKGGYLTSNRSLDCLALQNGEVHWLEATPVETPNTHGTGCTLAAACATYLAKGETVLTAAQKAKAFVAGAIVAGAKRQVGQGRGPVKHTWQVEGLEI